MQADICRVILDQEDFNWIDRPEDKINLRKISTPSAKARGPCSNDFSHSFRAETTEVVTTRERLQLPLRNRNLEAHVVTTLVVLLAEN